jgi:hypothetical protein
MKLKLTKHAQDMVSYRGLSIDHIKRAINEPDSKKDSYENKIKVIKKVDGKKIEVIYCKEGFKDKKGEYLVITAYYL